MGCSHAHSVQCPTSCQFRAGLPHRRALLLHSAKAAMEAPYPQHCRNAACPAMAKGGLRPLPSGIRRRFSSAAFSGVASDSHSGVQEQNKVHKAAGAQGKGFFLVVSRGQVYYRARGNAYSIALSCCPKDPLPWRRKGKEFQSWQGFNANPLSSARALLYSPLIFMLI